MLSIDVNRLWGDDVEEIVVALNEGIRNIDSYINYRKNNKYNKKLFNELKQDIRDIINFWVGRTYIGVGKNELMSKSYHDFYSNFMNLLLYFISDFSHKYERNYAENCLFRGKVYRYLGHADPLNCEEKIEVKYDELYASWSKLSYIPYIEGKLYGKKILISCEIKEPHYGIDLVALGVGRPYEQEVVFPTVKDLITDIQKV